MEEKKVVIRAYENEIEAELATGHLMSSGVTASIVKDDGGGMLPSLQKTAGVRLVVDESQVEKARSILPV